MTEERKCRPGAAEGHRRLALWSVLLAGAAVVLHCIATVMFRSGNDTGQMLVYAATVVAVGAIVCGVHALRRRDQGERFTWLGCAVGALCLVAVIPLLSFQKACRQWCIRSCIANMRNVDSAICTMGIEEPRLYETTKTSADFPARYLRNPKKICCPCMPGVPYVVYPTRCDGPNVVCPSHIKEPVKHAEHTMFGTYSNRIDSSVFNERLHICVAAIPAACVFFWGTIVCCGTRAATWKRCLAGVGCVASALYVATGMSRLSFCTALYDVRVYHREVCGENRSIVGGAQYEGPSVEYAAALAWTNAALIPVRYLKDRNAVCCPAAPGVPYGITIDEYNIHQDLTTGYTIRVVCPARKIDPGKYGDHDEDQ